MEQASKTETAVIPYEEKAIKEFTITPEEIAVKAEEYLGLKVLPDDPQSYRVAKAALSACVSYRTSTDKRRKELGEDARNWVNAVNAAQKALVAPLAPAEEHLRNELQIEDGRRAEVRAEKARKEKERIDNIKSKIERIRSNLLLIPGKRAHDLSVMIDNVSTIQVDEVYQEFQEEARKVLDEVKATLQKAFDERVSFELEEQSRKAEAERLEKIRKEQEAEAKRLAEEKAKMEAEKRAEQERKDREEFERQTKERAEAEARAKVEREEKERKEREAKAAQEEAERKAAEALEKARQEALRPDKDKIFAFGEAILSVIPPEVKDKKAIWCINDTVEKIDQAIQEMKEVAKRL